MSYLKLTVENRTTGKATTRCAELGLICDYIAELASIKPLDFAEEMGGEHREVTTMVTDTHYIEVAWLPPTHVLNRAAA